jgi:hypothetical protein
MARLLLIATFVGARGASSLASVGDLELMQIRDAPSNLRFEVGQNFFTYRDVPIYPHTPLGDLEDGEEARPWILELVNDSTDEELQHLIQELHTGQMTHPDRGELPMVVANMTAYGLMAMLDKHPGRVKVAEEDVFQLMINETIDLDERLRHERQMMPSSTQTSYPWGIHSIKADVVRGRGAGVNVYVLDTGIRTTHVEFGGRAFAGVDVATAGGNLTVCAPGSITCAADGHGHGTHCAGTVGASTYGVADGATIWAVKVLDDSGAGYVSWTNLAEQWILSSGFRPAVASLSLGGSGQSQSHQDSIDALVADGVTVVVAAGNQNADACGYNPAWIPSAITVGSYCSIGAKSSFSNYGSCVDVWAPGSSIISTVHVSDTATAALSGTSMACPHVSGLAAIMYEAYPSAPSMTASERWKLLIATNRTGWVTGIPSTDRTSGSAIIGNLVAEAPSARTHSQTPAQVSGTGDPHLTNMYGQRFDLYRPGVHVLLQIPRWAGLEGTLLRLEADARRMGACSELYFQALGISGIWTNRSGKLEFFAKSADKPNSMKWSRFGKVYLKVVNGHTREGIDYLNVFAKHIGNTGYSVGGLLGEDDHGDVSIPPKACAKQLSLIERPGSLISSAVVASLA